MTDKPKFSILKSEKVEEIAEVSAEERSKSLPPEDIVDIKTPVERLIQKELKTDKFVLAYFAENGDIGFYTGEGIDGPEISFITDVIKARVMMSLLLE